MLNELPYLESRILYEVSLGNQKAFTHLVNYYWNKVYAHSLAYTKSSHRAQEITQDIFLKVWNNRDKLKDVRNFKNYLFILGRNQILTAIRHKLIELSKDDILEGEESTILPGNQLECKETWSKILEGIEKLPPTRQQIFKMNRFEGLSYQEIALKLNISKHTVKEHIVLALNFLRTYLRVHDVIPMLLICAGNYGCS